VVFDQSSDNLRSTHKRIHWAKKLRDALDEDRLTLFSQPVVRLTDQHPVHHEILVRIRDDEGRYITPVNFIELAENLGLVKEIDMQVVEKLLQFMQERGEAGQKIRYFVNLSRVSIADAVWVKRFVKLLETSPVKPSQLAFEITETAAMSEIDVTLAFIRRLKSMGCRFALDDFGVGMSSFTYLKHLPVDFLKIDGSFVRDLTHNHADREIVAAMVRIAHGLDIKTIAEAVHSEAVLDVTRGIGVDYAQGYWIARPRPASLILNARAESAEAELVVMDPAAPPPRRAGPRWPRPTPRGGWRASG
jgi:EAL domain-containing protein (putative c-di-GMP-specific phosphodiesterase class I)